MRETAPLDTPSISLRARLADPARPTKLPLARRLRLYLAWDTDIELAPDQRSTRQKLYDASICLLLLILVVPWLCIVVAMWLTLMLLGRGKPDAL